LRDCFATGSDSRRIARDRRRKAPLFALGNAASTPSRFAPTATPRKLASFAISIALHVDDENAGTLVPAPPAP
jgi:hypothetical protein